MTTTTYAEALSRIGITVPAHLEADLAVPVISDVPQRQGDVFVAPVVEAPPGLAFSPVEARGVQVVFGEATGNTHWLHTDMGSAAPVEWAPVRHPLHLGYLSVPEGSVAMLSHTDEHGCNAFGPGVYRVTGKREQADEIRRVTD